VECGPPWPFERPWVAVAEAVAVGVGDVVRLGWGPALGDGLDGPVFGDVPPGAPAWPELPPDAPGAPAPPWVSPWAPPWSPLDEGACGAAQWVNGAWGPPVVAMMTATRKAASTAMEPIPAKRSTWCRRPDGSAKTGLDSTAEW
jgi:hypothetical protein